MAAKSDAQPRLQECPPCTSKSGCCGTCACVHGRCGQGSQRETCLCEPDWFGDSCDVHIFSAGYYMPLRDPSERTPRREAQSHMFADPAARLVAAVDKLQHGHACGQAESLAQGCSPLHVVMEGRGFGSWVHHMVGALTHALVHNLTLIPRYPYDYFLHDGCPLRTHSQMEVRGFPPLSLPLCTHFAYVCPHACSWKGEGGRKVGRWELVKEPCLVWHLREHA